VHGLLLLVGVVVALVASWSLYRRRTAKAGILAGIGGAFLVWWAVTDTVPREFVAATPYLVTLIVLAFASQRLRPPEAIGRPYRRGQSH
jgi:general nucleoside transport system permease protein